MTAPPPAPHLPVVHLALRARTLGELLRLRARETGERPALYRKDRAGGTWVPLTWAGFFDAAARAAHGLCQLGIPVGDRVAIIGPTQPPWTIYDFAGQLAGLVTLGIYPQQTVEQVRYILSHSDTRVVFVGDAVELETVLAAAAECPQLLAIVPWEDRDYQAWKDKDPRIVSPDRFREKALSDAELDARLQAVDPDGMAILIYTSGTTGPPKGAMVSHRNIMAMFASGDHYQRVYQDDYTFSFLPMAHAAERVLASFGRVSSGVATYYASSMSSVLTEIGEVRPTIFGSVPRIFEKAYNKIRAEVERKGKAVQALFDWASDVGIRRAKLLLEQRPVPLALALQYKVADKLVFSKLRAAFGGKVRYFVVGAAPTPVPILEFFFAAGLPIYEVFGMTEATVLTHANIEGATRLGTVGRVVPPLECRIADDGEILIRGPWVFKGYFKQEEATREVVKDGWLHTGDIGTLDAEGYLRITDRKKHLIITAGGKNLAPANIEAAIKSADPLISHVVAVGDRRPYVTALIAPSPLETLEWGAERGLISKEELKVRTAELLANPSARSEALNLAMAKVAGHKDYVARICAAVKRGNEKLAHVESVRRFLLHDRDFSQEHGELTPTLKVKRKELLARHAERFDKLYEDESFGLAV